MHVGRSFSFSREIAIFLPIFFEIFRCDFRKYFSGIFGLLMQRNRQKRDKKNRREKTKGKKFFFLSTFSDFLQKVFVVFSGSSCRETAKNAIKKYRREKTKGKKFFSSQLFRPKAFDMDFLLKVFCGVFELPLLRNAQKRHKTNLKNKIKKKYLPTPFASARYTSLSILFFSGAPRQLVVGMYKCEARGGRLWVTVGCGLQLQGCELRAASCQAVAPSTGACAHACGVRSKRRVISYFCLYLLQLKRQTLHSH
jgi:hypothetical protein